MALDDYFTRPPPKVLNPIARKWERKLAQYKTVRCLFWRQRDGLVYLPAGLTVYFIDSENRQRDSERVPWERSLHEWLISKRGRCKTDANEAERFGYAMKAEMEPIEIQYGDGFFNSVLVAHIRDTFTAPDESLGPVLAAIHRHSASGSSMIKCREMIDTIFRYTAHSLFKLLRYPQDEASSILQGAVAYYIDERFNVTNRRFLGWL